MSGYPKSYYGEQNIATGEAISTNKRSRLTYRQELDQFVLGLPQGASVLDVGCAEGRVLARVREIRPHLKLSSFVPRKLHLV